MASATSALQMDAAWAVTGQEPIAPFVIAPIAVASCVIVPLFIFKHIQSNAGPGGIRDQVCIDGFHLCQTVL